MKSNTNLTVKDACEAGIPVCLPNILDEHFALIKDGVYPDIALSIIATHIATEHNLTQKQGQDVARFTFNKLGVIV